jgi:hypothetical protein
MRILTLILVLAVRPLFSQTDLVLNDAGISWAATFDLMLPADPLQATILEYKEASAAILKLTMPDQSLRGFVDHSLNKKLWEVAEAGLWEAYADPDLSEPLDRDQINKIIMGQDTTVTFDPETYEERISIVFESHPFPSQMPFVKVRQLLAYHEADARFSLYTTAVAACTELGETLFWLKPPETNLFAQADLLEQRDISWAVRYKTKFASPRLADFQVIKNTAGVFAERFLNRIKTSPEIPLYDPQGELLSAFDRANLFFSTDTVVAVDPTTYEERSKIIHREYPSEKLVDLQLIQEWYWNDLTGELLTQLVAVGPRFRMELNDEWFPAVRFYRRCDEK